MRATRQIRAIPFVALACTSCSSSTPYVGFDPDASSGADSGSLWSGTPKDAGTFAPDAHAPPPPPPPPPAYDSGTPAAIDAGPPVACATAVIDDMERNDGAILSVCGRQGYWYTYNDGTAGGTQTPLASASFKPTDLQDGHLLGDGGASTHAARTYGKGFTTWGAGMAFDLNSPGAAIKLPYNAAHYTGITFWARAESATQTALRVNVPQIATDPIGNVCAPKCNDHFGKNITLTTSWLAYTIEFNELAQSGWGPAATFDKSTLLGVQFQVSAGSTFDFWIDDIAFLE